MTGHDMRTPFQHINAQVIADERKAERRARVKSEIRLLCAAVLVVALGAIAISAGTRALYLHGENYVGPVHYTADGVPGDYRQ